MITSDDLLLLATDTELDDLRQRIAARLATGTTVPAYPVAAGAAMVSDFPEIAADPFVHALTAGDQAPEPEPDPEPAGPYTVVYGAYNKRVAAGYQAQRRRLERYVDPHTGALYLLTFARRLDGPPAGYGPVLLAPGRLTFTWYDESYQLEAVEFIATP